MSSRSIFGNSVSELPADNGISGEVFSTDGKDVYSWGPVPPDATKLSLTGGTMTGDLSVPTATVTTDFKYTKGFFEWYVVNNTTLTDIVPVGPNVPTPVLYAAASINVNAGNVGWTVSTAGRYTYTGSRARFFHMGITFSFTSNKNDELCDFFVYKNGILVPGSRVQIHSRQTAQSSAIHLIGNAVSPGDYFELWMSSDKADLKATLTYANFFGLALPNVI